MDNKKPIRETQAKRQAESFETFMKPSSFSIGNLKVNEPWCFNGGLGISKYRITIEPIEESIAMYFSNGLGSCGLSARTIIIGQSYNRKLND